MGHCKAGNKDGSNTIDNWWSRIYRRPDIRHFYRRHVSPCWTGIGIGIVITVIALASCQRGNGEIEYIRCIETRTITSITSGETVIQAPTGVGVVICPK